MICFTDLIIYENINFLFTLLEAIKYCFYLVNSLEIDIVIISHCLSIIFMFFILKPKNKNMYNSTTLIIYIILQSFVLFNYESMQNSWIYFVVMIYFCIALAFDNNEYNDEDRLEKFICFLVYDTALFFALLGSMFLMGLGLRHFLVVSDIISIVIPRMDIVIYLDWVYAFFLVYVIINIIVIFLSYNSGESFSLDDYINCKSLLVCLLSISLGFVFKIYILQPIFNNLYLQIIKIEQFIHVLGSKIVSKLHLTNEFLINCIKIHSVRNTVTYHIRNNWVFHVWNFKNMYTYQCKIIKSTSISIGTWATTMAKPIYLENKYMYFKDGYRYLRPTFFFECVKEFSKENSYFTNLEIYNFINKTNYANTNSCLVLNNHCNSLIKSVFCEIDNLKVLIRSVYKTNLLEFSGNKEFFVKDLDLNIKDIYSNIISRNPNVNETFNIIQAIKNIQGLNYNIDLDLKDMFKLHVDNNGGIPITDFLCNILFIHNNKLRIGYLVASRLAFLTYDFPNKSLDCFIMEKFKQDYGHLFIIDYLYVYYPYIPYFDCCIINGSKIVAHDLSPALHTDNNLNFMFHSGELDNVDHLDESNALLGQSYFDNFDTKNYLPLDNTVEDNKQFFKHFFDLYDLRVASLGMTNHNELYDDYYYLRYFITNQPRYIHLDINHSFKPKHGHLWFVHRMIDAGRNLFLNRFVNNCHSIFFDGTKVIFADYKDYKSFWFYDNDIIQEKRLHPHMSWRNYENCNLLNLKIDNPRHVEMLDMLNISIMFSKDHLQFYKKNPEANQDIMNLLKETDNIYKRHYFVLDINNKNASYYIDYTMRCLFNMPSSLLNDKPRQHDTCKFIFKDNFGSKQPVNWI